MRRLICWSALLAFSAPAMAQDYSPNPYIAGLDTYASQYPATADFVQARAALDAGNFESAARMYTRLADGTANPSVSLLAGYANLGAGRIGQAEAQFERSLWLDNRSAFARHGLGMVALLKGDRPAAAAQLSMLEGASARCRDDCPRADEIERALASLRRAIG